PLFRSPPPAGHPSRSTDPASERGPAGPASTGAPGAHAGARGKADRGGEGASRLAEGKANAKASRRGLHQAAGFWARDEVGVGQGTQDGERLTLAGVSWHGGDQRGAKAKSYFYQRASLLERKRTDAGKNQKKSGKRRKAPLRPRGSDALASAHCPSRLQIAIFPLQETSIHPNTSGRY